MNKVEWKTISENTQKLRPQVNQILNSWLSENPDWTGWLLFSDYPPRFHGIFEVLHINQLSDKRLDSLGELATKLCNECGLMGRKYHNTKSSANKVEYKFWLPIK
jgi:hypothetical protein